MLPVSVRGSRGRPDLVILGQGEIRKQCVSAIKTGIVQSQVESESRVVAESKRAKVEVKPKLGSWR